MSILNESFVKECKTLIQPNWQETEVVVNLGTALNQRYAEDLANRIAVYKSQLNVADFTEDLVRYFNLLIIARVRHVNRKPCLIKVRDNNLVVPALMSEVLTGIGRVENYELGVAITPIIEGEIKEEDSTFALSFSRQLRGYLLQANITFATGIIADRSGAYEAMLLQVINDKVVGETALIHPVNALITGFLELEHLKEVLFPRVSYGSMSEVTRQFVKGMDYEQTSSQK